MAYTPNTAGARIKPRRNTTSFGAPKGQNLIEFPQLLDASNAQVILNFLIDASGNLVKTGFRTEIIAQAATTPTMLEEFTDRFWIVGFDTSIGYYDTEDNVLTIAKSDYPTGTKFEGVKNGDFFYFTTGTTEVQYFTFTLGANLIDNTSWTGAGWSVTTDVLETLTDSAGQIAQPLTLTLGSRYRITYDLPNYNTYTGAGGDPLEFYFNGAFDKTNMARYQALDIQHTAVDDSISDFTIYHVDRGSVSGLKVQDVRVQLIDETSLTLSAIGGTPNAKVIHVFDRRLFIGDTESDSSEVLYSAIPDLNTLASDFTASTAADGAGQIVNPAKGELSAISDDGNKVILFYADGKAAFRIRTEQDSSGVYFKRDETAWDKADFGGARAVAKTPIGLVYGNERGFWSLSGSQDTELSHNLGAAYFSDVDMTDVDIVYDKANTIILFVFKKGNDRVAKWYHINTKAWGDISWDLSRIMTAGNFTYGLGYADADIYKLFDGTDDHGNSVECRFEQELNIGDLNTRKNLRQGWIQQQLGGTQIVEYAFDAYLRNTTTGDWELSEDKLAIQTTRNFSGFRDAIRNCQRLVLKIQEISTENLTVNWVRLQTEEGREIRKVTGTTGDLALALSDATDMELSDGTTLILS